MLPLRIFPKELAGATSVARTSECEKERMDPTHSTDGSTTATTTVATGSDNATHDCGNDSTLENVLGNYVSKRMRGLKYKYPIQIILLI